ncbi:MAG: hypothetical protein JXL84_03510 [Deltaproteobacteria bacterium]|nr:hypothetical protein [Deltaproteobacteria bacterium]
MDVRYLRSFRVGDGLGEIRCPCLAMVGEGEGADSPCQVGNLSFAAAVFPDWLEETFHCR